MELYFKNDKTGKEGTKMGVKVDKGTAVVLGKVATSALTKLMKDSENDQALKDAASKCILKSVDYMNKAEETDDPELKEEYKKKSKDLEEKAKEITSLIKKKKEILKSKEIKESEELLIEACGNDNISVEELYDYLDIME